MDNYKDNRLNVYFDVKIHRDEQVTFYDIDTIARRIFDFLVYEKNLQNESLVLVSPSGLVLSSFPRIDASKQSFTFDPRDSFAIVSPSARERQKDIENLVDDFSNLFSIFYHNEHLREFIFNGLDALPNSICVYDKDLRLLYANSDFCNYIRIKNRGSEIGKNIYDILDNCGTKFLSIRKPHDQLRVQDVIKYGKPVIDWEVEVVNVNDPSSKESLMASNDMYPIINDNGHVEGVSEISRSRNTKINQVRDTLGLSADYTFEDILGESKCMTDAKKLAMSFAVSPYNVLIYGESGVGKELFAQSIHNYSIRRNKPFVAINCASISPELIDSELFGYESGAFTGASKNGHIGKIELSSGGTLFLDEIAELPLHAQTRLLRTLETKQITRVGGTKNIPVDVRVIAATNRSLEKMIEEGLFREDLYYRLMVLNLTIPPLRERPEDIIPCCESFLRQAMNINNSELKTISEDAKRMLLEYNWPGNVRELRNVINRMYILSPSTVITKETVVNAFQSNTFHYNSLIVDKSPEEMIAEKRAQIDKTYASLLKEALLLCNDNKTEAAKLLNVSRKTVYNLLEKYKDYFD